MAAGEATRAALRTRFSRGARSGLGEAAGVAREVPDDPALVPALIDCLEDTDRSVVSHAAHAAMQVARDRPAPFEPFASRLTDILETSPVWEIGEQMPKILVALALDAAQAARLRAVLERQLGASSAIAAASALTAIVELAARGLFEPGEARRIVAQALSSPRRAVAARARKLSHF